MGEIDIENLTMEQYLALECGDTRRRIRKPEIEGNIDFEIKEKLKSLNRDMQNLKENVHAIKGRYESSDELNYPPSEEVKCVKASEYRKDSLEMTPGIRKKIGEEDGSPLEAPAKEPRTFAEKVKRLINEEQEKGERLL
nr:hypothetical protein [Tanacetum cinerariifolium]